LELLTSTIQIADISNCE